MSIPSKYLDQSVTIKRQGSASYDAYGNPSQSFATSSASVSARLERISGKLDEADEGVLQYTQYEDWRMWTAVGEDITRKDVVEWTYSGTTYSFDVIDVHDQVGSTGFHHKLSTLRRIT